LTMLCVALDSNLLLLYLVGATSREHIGKHKRLRAYSMEDFDLLLEQLGNVSSIVLTPNTLTETSNLIDHIGAPAKHQIYETLRILLNSDGAVERYLPSVEVVRATELPRLGLTDSALLDVCSGGIPLLTADLALYLAALDRSAKAVNFNHLRDSAA
jgi:hypothetical protein